MIDEIDKDILEYTANEEPWHVVCGEFHERFKKPEELVTCLIQLRDLGLIRIERQDNKDAKVDRSDLIEDAIANEWHETTIWPNGPVWNIEATEAGFSLVRERFHETQD